MSNKNLLILERSSSALVQGNTDKYVLEGIFGELDVKNRNNRIYTAEEYVPQIEALQDKIKASKLLGELDHPSNFDISLKNVSHIIEEITYDKEAKQIKGRIRLLDTDAGRQAKALVDAGVPLQISSRAAGAVESNGTVKIKQLFTYDLVADPGFANAELTRVNESYGFANDSDILIYEIGESLDLLTNETKTTENKIQSKMAESKFITAEDFNKYSQYLSEEIKTIKESLTEAKETGNETELSNLKEYTTYLAEKLDQNIQYAEHVAEKTDQSIQYSEELAEKLDQGIQYSEHIVVGVDQIKEYTNYLAESYNEGATTHENLLEYVEYLKTNLEKVTEYAEYVAETVNTNLLLEDEAGKEVEEIEAENDAEDVTEKHHDGNLLDWFNGLTDKDLKSEKSFLAIGKSAGWDKKDLENIMADAEQGDESNFQWAKDIVVEAEAPAKEVEEVEEDNAEEIEDEINDLGEVEELAEDKAGKEVEEIEDEQDNKDVTEPIVDTDGEEVEGEVENVEADLELDGEGEAEGEEIKEEATIDSLDTYKNEITEKLQTLINKATETKTDNPHFFKFVSESTQSEFNVLESEDKTKVLSAIEGRGYLTEGQILGLWKNSLLTATVTNEPNVISMMPAEYKETFTKLSESKKNSILAQSKMHKLETSYQVANFWQTRDLREVSQVMEKVTMVKESVEVKPTIGYDMSDIAAQIASKFKK